MNRISGSVGLIAINVILAWIAFYPVQAQMAESPCRPCWSGPRFLGDATPGWHAPYQFSLWAWQEFPGVIFSPGHGIVIMRCSHALDMIHACCVPQHP